MKGISIMETSTIIPIVIALLLFFGSMVSAMNTVEKKNRKIDMVFSLIQIVDRLTEAGVITKDRFDETSKVLEQTLPVNFYLCITSVDDTELTNCQLRYPNNKYPKDVVRNISSDYVSASLPVTYQTTIRGVPFNEVNKLVVIVWQGA